MISVADLLDWLGNPSEEGVNDLLTALESRAVEMFEAETDRYFGTATARTEYLRGDGTNVLRLRENPSALTSIEYRSQVGDSWTAIADTDSDGWELRRPTGSDLSDPATVLRKAGYVWSCEYEYRVIYSFGYTAGAEPGDVRQAVMDIVAFFYQERGRQGLRGETIGDYSYSVLTESTGKRSMASAIPGLAVTIARWKGMVYA